MKSLIYLYVLLLAPDDGRLVASTNEPHKTLAACKAAGVEYQRRWREEYTEADRAGHQMVTFCSYSKPKSFGAHMENPSANK